MMRLRPRLTNRTDRSAPWVAVLLLVALGGGGCGSQGSGVSATADAVDDAAVVDVGLDVGVLPDADPTSGGVDGDGDGDDDGDGDVDDVGAVADTVADTDAVADADADAVADADADAVADADADADPEDAATADVVDDGFFGDCGSGCDVLAPGGDADSNTESDATGPGTGPGTGPDADVVGDADSDATAPDTTPGWNPTPGPDDLKFDFAASGVVLQPGKEDILCWYLPPDGKEHWMVAVDASFKHDVHHLRVDRILDTKGKKAFGPVSCIDGSTSSPYEPGWETSGELPGSQEAVLHMQFPPGHGFRIGPKHGMYFELHVLNTTTKPKKIEGYYHVYTAAKAAVSNPVGMFLHFNQKCNYPPGISTQSITCTAPHDMNMLFGMGHMHFFGIDLSVKVNGQLMYNTKDVEDVTVSEWKLPGFQIKKGDKITTSCTYDNKLKNNLLTGYSDIYNAMCGFVGFFTPTVDSESLNCEF